MNNNQLTLKDGTGMHMADGQDIFMPLRLFFTSPVAAWFSSLDPNFEKKNNRISLLQEKFVKRNEYVQ